MRYFCLSRGLGDVYKGQVWQSGVLVGGLYGVALGRAFFGESMFSRVTDASKTALVHLVARLRLWGFTVLDTQFGTEHLARFGGVEIPAASYKEKLALAVSAPQCWRGMENEKEVWNAEIRTMGT